MSRQVLKAQKRDASGKSPVARRLRKTGVTPGVLYRKDASLPFAATELDVAALLRHGATLVDIDVDGERHISVIKDYQVHPVRGTLVHIDLQEVRMDEIVRTVTSLVLTGEAIGVAEGGMLNQVLHELNIESTPGDIPDTIEVDVSALYVGASLAVSDITPPTGVTLLDDQDATIVSVTALRAVEEEEEPEAAEGEETVAEGEAGAETETPGSES